MSAARRLHAIEIPGPAGPLEALLDRVAGEEPRFAALVCHPHPLYGGTMHNKVVHRMATELARLGAVALRVNFRGVGRSAGEFSGGPGERQDAGAAIAWLAARHPGLPLWVAGFSFGSWAGLAAGSADPRVTRLVAVAPPVSRQDFSFLERSPRPKLVIQGDADEVCPLERLRPVYAGWLEPKQLVEVHGANHFFDRHLSGLSKALRDNVSAPSVRPA